jgi:glyoxylase-like metal-dependent hydrolase (beta-lactamase superfamily II)
VPKLADLGVACLRAANPGPYTLSGSNTWIIGRDPAWVVDPGPALPEHIEAIASEVEARGGAGGIAITHDHDDHVEGVPALRERLGGTRVAALRYPADLVLRDGDSFGPLAVVAIPGHAPDHLAFVAGAVCFSGDAILGEGSVFVAEALGDYLAALERLRELALTVICPGHGPPVWTPREKLDQYLSHRRERERRLIAALEAGLYERDELLDAVWDDAPAALRPAAAITLAAHLQKLRDEGRLPPPGDAGPGPSPR